MLITVSQGVQDNILNCPLLSHQQSKTQGYSFRQHIKMDKHSKSSIWRSRNNQNLEKWLKALYRFSSTMTTLSPGVQINGIHKRGVHSLSTVLPFNNSGSRLFSGPASGSPVSRDQRPSVSPLRSVVRSLQALLVCVVDRARVTCGASYWSVFFFLLLELLRHLSFTLHSPHQRTWTVVVRELRSRSRSHIQR